VVSFSESLGDIPGAHAGEKRLSQYKERLQGVVWVVRMAGGMWAPFKELVGVINAAVLNKDPNAYYSLEAELKKHKPDFISLLKNPVSWCGWNVCTNEHYIITCSV